MGLTDQVEQKLEMGCAILKMFTSSLAFGATSLTMHLLDRRATLWQCPKTWICPDNGGWLKIQKWLKGIINHEISGTSFLDVFRGSHMPLCNLSHNYILPRLHEIFVGFLQPGSHHKRWRGPATIYPICGNPMVFLGNQSTNGQIPLRFSHDMINACTHSRICSSNITIKYHF